jgi:hypothetical protein
MQWNNPLENLNRAFSEIRRPTTAAGFYDNGFHSHQAASSDTDYSRPSSQMNRSRATNASHVEPEVSTKQKLMLYLGAKRLSSTKVKPTSLLMDADGNLSPQSFAVLSPTTSDLSIASRASTEKWDGHRDYLISSRKARMAAEVDLQVCAHRVMLCAPWSMLLTVALFQVVSARLNKLEAEARRAALNAKASAHTADEVQRRREARAMQQRARERAEEEARRAAEAAKAELHEAHVAMQVLGCF